MHCVMNISLVARRVLDTYCSLFFSFFKIPICNIWSYFYLVIWHFSLTLEVLSKRAMASHSSTLAWEIPWTEEPGRLQSMGSLRVGHDWVTSLWLFTFMHWRRKWQPTPVFLPGESQGRGSLVGCRLWGRTKSDTTDTSGHNWAEWNLFLKAVFAFYTQKNKTL